MADQKTFTSAQEAVNDLVPGARVVGQIPFYITEPIPEAERARDGPTTRSVQRGLEISYIRPDGEPDKIVIGPSYEQKEGEPIPVGATVTWNNTPGAPLPPATVILKGPTQGPSAQTTQPGSPMDQWVRLDANGQVITDPAKYGSAVYIRDPKAPATTQPFKLEEAGKTGDPSQWVEKVIAGATVVYDPVKGAVVATVAPRADSADKATGTYTPMYDPNDPKRVIAMIDDGSKQPFPVAREPKSQKQIITTPNKVFVFNDDGSLAGDPIDITPEKAPVVVPMGNTVYVFDPATKTFTKGPEVDEPATVGISTQNEWYIFFDKNGKEVSRVKNPSWTGVPQTAAPPTSLTAPKVPKWNAKTGEWEYVPNEGRLTIGEAAQAMIKDLTGHTVDPNNPLTLDEANTILTTAINKMNADAQQAATASGAAQNILSTQAQGAQTGAGLLQQRQATTQNLIQQGLGVATSTGGRYGNYSGGMLSPVPGLAQGLVSGAAEFATELGGGQAVFDTAVRMVQAADPNNSNPDRAAAVGLLRQIMDGYQKATGQKHPAVVATEAAQQSNQGQQFVSPAAVTPEVFQAQFDPRLNPAAPQQPQGTVLPPGVAGTVAPGSPGYIGTMPATMAQPRTAEELGSVVGAAASDQYRGFVAPGLSW